MAQPPHFVIIGAPKCGTTSLYFYLQQHPSVFMPDNKEPRFFCDYPINEFEFGTKQFHPNIVIDRQQYESLFADAPAGAKIGEASTDYLSTKGVAQRIHAWNQDAKIIIMLRDPIGRAYSEYRHTIMANFQQNSFAESIQMEPRRLAEGYDPIFGHLKRGLYFDGVASFIGRFGRENVKVILFEDFAQRPTEIVQEVFKFLDVEPIQIDTTQRYNADDKALPVAIPPHDKRTLLERLATSYRRLILGEDEKVRVGASAVLTRREYNSFRSKFVKDIRKTEKLIGVKLGHWLQPY